MEMVLAMNTGVEACESSIKIARRWGYEKKGIPANQAKVVFVNENFWGRTISAVSSSSDPESFEGYGPYTPGFSLIDYNDLDAVEEALRDDPNVCAFMCEPIQGEAGVVVPDPGYLRGVRELCDKYNVLWICDEVQTGCGRTGKRLCVDWEGVQPDMITMGKAISGGVYPVSVVVGKKKCMDVLTPGTHGSTYGGNPLATSVAITALEVLRDEKLAENAEKVGTYLRGELDSFVEEFGFMELTRGKGLLNAIVIDDKHHTSAWDICIELAKAGLLCKPTHDHIIRLAPPLCITEAQIDECLDIMHTTFKRCV
jgi:ornithine--oxo-acid transaminase